MTAPGRYWIVGTSGSGKSTLAARISTRLGVPHIELDGHQHGPNWTAASPEQLLAAVRAALARGDTTYAGWVVDGNYYSVLGDLLEQRAETVVWLDYPRWVVMLRLVRRTAARVLTRRELWNGNRERLRSLVRRDPESNILLWAWTTHARIHHRYLVRSQESARTWVRLRSPRETDEWLASLPEEP